MVSFCTLSFPEEYTALAAWYERCSLCPRACGIDRLERAGVCGASDVLRIGRAALHWWEEPCLVGEQGSGAIFFSHCALGCVYCQNKALAQGAGVDVSVERLAQVMLDLQNEQRAANINLVTASHYAPSVARVLRSLRRSEEDQHSDAMLHIPVVWNSAGYEGQATLQLLDGLVDIYLVDFKYANPKTAQRLSHAQDYPDIALAAIDEMLSQVGEPQFDENGLLRKGVIVRHLVLPGYVDDSLEALSVIHERFGNRVLVSIMNQFTVVDSDLDLRAYGLEEMVSDEDYERVLDHADALGIEDYFWQEGGAASESFVPAFDGTGVLC